MLLTSEDLLTVARNYWPSTRDAYLEQEASPELKRLQALWEQTLPGLDRWWSFLSELETALPDFKLSDVTATRDACFRCVAYPRNTSSYSQSRWAAVGCLSILAPVCFVYGVQLEYRGTERISQRASFGPLPPETAHVADLMAQKMESNFRATSLPRELTQTRVPLFVEFKEPPETMLVHALFTSSPESIP
ncbi:hypothetical protein JY651_39740 [Pyxidicoccus parkwayensis]|uniref:Uncharacterized protein n=1 Tax=Pyxidicoccus parkwayensis TaxID=2813578 RepID=A0ABX7NYV9_9BACT|nr:hypothetical protein [Pyxidicoccus parkwaysis]QSQ21263.1 hypothetical protein JY651_39740 [Pyxidicoccus parkwaysis]